MDVIIGRQSILDRDQKIVAYELLFRNKDNTPITSDTEATSNVIANTLSMFTQENILNNKKGFINIDIEFLRQGFLDVLPANKFVVEILETQDPSKELLSLIKKYKAKGFTFALDDFILSEEMLNHWKPILDEVDLIKVEVIGLSVNELRHKVKLLDFYKGQLLAEKVESKEVFDICYELGYHYFQGFYFTKPVIIEGQRFHPNVQGILSVQQLIQQGAEISEIEDKLKLYPDITLSLLRIANSASVAPRSEITSIKQTLALLGTKAIAQWLLLLLYSARQDNISMGSDPIFLTAVQRGYMMKHLVEIMATKKDKSIEDSCFLAGLLSLSDVVLHIPLQSILKELNISQVIKDGLTERTGIIGTAFKVVLIFELQEFSKLSTFCERTNISLETINKIATDALLYSHMIANDF